MTDAEFMAQVTKRLRQMQSEQRVLQERLATDLGGLHKFRMPLLTFSGVLALGLGLSLGYQIARR